MRPHTNAPVAPIPNVQERTSREPLPRKGERRSIHPHTATGKTKTGTTEDGGLRWNQPIADPKGDAFQTSALNRERDFFLHSSAPPRGSPTGGGPAGNAGTTNTTAHRGSNCHCSRSDEPRGEHTEETYRREHRMSGGKGNSVDGHRHLRSTKNRARPPTHTHKNRQQTKAPLLEFPQQRQEK